MARTPDVRANAQAAQLANSKGLRTSKFPDPNYVCNTNKINLTCRILPN